jgi:subtilase family serine protease
VDAALADQAVRSGMPVLIGRVDSHQPVKIEAVLSLRNQPQLADLLKRLYAPGDALYGHYLTPAEFSKDFGPTQADVDAVSSYFTAHGLSITKASLIQGLVEGTCTASAAEKAFGIKLNTFVAPSGHVFMSNDKPVVLPSDIAPKVTTLLGLYTGAEIDHFSHRSTPNLNAELGYTGYSGLSPADIFTIYDLNGLPNDFRTTNQVLAVFEEGTFTPTDIEEYAATYGTGLPPGYTISVDGFNTSEAPGGAAGEVTLDLELFCAVAGNASQFQVYETNDKLTAQTDIIQEYIDSFKDMATISSTTSLPRPNVISVSYAISELFYLSENNPQGPADATAEYSALEQLAAQGQSVFAASGDRAAWMYNTSYPNVPPNVGDPASQPLVTGVGGTNMADVASGENYYYDGESSWYDPSDTGKGPGGTGGGGGISLLWNIPSWQVATFDPSVNTQGSTTMRNVPDVSLYGDFDTGGYSIYFTDPTSGAGWVGENGTSAATPIWAAYISDVNYFREQKGLPVLGFANPALYAIGTSSDYSTDFHDIADGSTNGYFKAVRGYDNSTGLGSFYMGPLYADLVRTRATSKTVVTSSLNPSAVGQAVPVTVTATGSSPTGNVVIYIDGSMAGVFALSSAKWSGNVTGLKVGSHTIAAAYNGDLNNTSSSGTLTQVVNAVAVATTTTLVSSLNPATAKQSVTFTATVKASSGTPTGSVTFYNGTSALGTETLSSGVAKYTTATLAAATYSIKAVFAGNSSFLTSTSNVISQVIKPAPVVPTVTSIKPTSGPIAGGTAVTITGTGFIAGATVKFGTVAATSVVVVNSTSITCKSPKEAASTVHVLVTTAGGTSATVTAGNFTYDPIPTVTSLKPASGPIAGGTAVTITGTGFIAGATVTFGTVAAISVVVVNSTSITCKSPKEAASTVHVLVTTAGGTSAAVTAGNFTYDPIPTVTSLKPASGPIAGGTAVTITGTGFVAGATVKFGTVAATSVVLVSSTTLTCKSPAEAAATVNVTVTTVGGTSAAVTGDKFTY